MTPRSRSSLLILMAAAATVRGDSAPPTPASGALAEQAAQRAAAALYDNIRSETLPNGLHVYLKAIPGAPVVTTMVAYRVGSADEDLNNTGLSHYLEHLMFKGTDRIRPGDIDRLTLRNGGANNAYTSEDYTIYHFDFAADRWDAALAIEADRMRNLRIDAEHEFEQEKGAVIEELQRDEDTPWDLEQKAILPLLFGAQAPYGHPVIGERQHVRGATAKIIKSHYDRWYYPNNASLVICGGFDAEQVLARVRQLFGSLPAGQLPPRKVAPAVSRDQPVHRQIDSKFEVPRILMGFNTLRTGEPGYYALEVIDAVLGNGKTGRLYRRLVEGKEVAGAVATSDSAGRYPGWFSIQVELLRGKNPGPVEALVVAELQRLADQPIDEAELNRAKRTILASTIFGRESVHGLADTIARGVTTNNLDYLRTYLPRIAAVSARDVQETSRKYLDPRRRVAVWSIPGLHGRSSGGNGTAPGADGHRRNDQTGAASASPVTQTLRQARRVVLENGLTILMLENHRLPIVVAAAKVHHSRLLEPADKAGVANLTGRLLDEGTARHSGREIADLIEGVGGSLNVSSSGGSVQVLAPDRQLGLTLLMECLTQPNFPAQAFGREKQRLLSQIADAERQPDLRARWTFDNLVYGEHPLARPAIGRLDTTSRLRREDCVAFHRQLFVPGNTTIALVGDFDAGQVVKELSELVTRASWGKANVPQPHPPAVEKPKALTQKILTMPGAVQLHFFMGHVGIRRNNPDYYKLLVMDYVLGTGPGFTDRLSARLRDRLGLAYTVQANITSSAGEEPGEFACYIGTDPRNFAQVKQAFLEEIRRIRDVPAATTEVEDAKQYLLGILPFQMLTDAQIAGQLLMIEQFHLGLDHFDNYRRQVAAVTPSDVQAVARKYLDPDRLVVVVAGPVNATGNVLPATPTGASVPQK